MIKRRIGPLLSGVLVAAAVCSVIAAEPIELTRKSYESYGRTMGTVVLHVNWGRHWGCGAYENAQLEELQFTKLATDSNETATEVHLSPASRLLVNNDFRPYALLIEPGEYALSAFDVKLAKTQNEIRHQLARKNDLVVDGKPTGGTFRVDAGEIVYIGNFSVDCNGEPRLWRTYIEGSGEFDRYVAGFHKHFSFTSSEPVKYRLFATEEFGTPYSLPDAQVPAH